MDTLLPNANQNEMVHEGSTTTPTDNSVTTAHVDEKELKMEVRPVLMQQDTENQATTEGPSDVAVSPTIDVLSPSEDAIKVEDKMDTEQSAADNETESTSESLSSQDTSITPTDTATSKPDDKKPRARVSSESPHTPTENKIARLTPRATRSSQNPDFAAKQRKFLNRVHHDPIKNNSNVDNPQGSPTVMKGIKENKAKSVEKTPNSSDIKRKSDKESALKRPADSDDEGSAKKRKTKEPTKVVGGVDSYCWRCHRDGVVIRCECTPCPRVYHVKCVQLDKPPDNPWMCPECSLITQAEDTDTRSRAMRMLSLDQLCKLLQFALNRMKSHEGAEDFSKPVDPEQFPYYRDYIVKPMDLIQLERNIKARLYGSTEAFLADAKWIVHNSIIFNSVQSKFTNTARALLKLCRQEMQHIENCPDCYQNSHTRSSDSWFTEACRRPHILVWAKLKGFPFWPAKVMSVNPENNQVDVRFFGAHDRAWIPLNQCYLFSKLSPTPTTNNKNKRTLEDCLQELEYHIKRLRDKFGHFEYAPYKTPYDPKDEDAQLLMMLPQYETKVAGKRSRLSLHQDGARKSLGRRATSPKQLSPEKPSAEETAAIAATVNGVSGAESPSKQDDQPMVFIPGGKSKGPARTSTKVTPPRQGESEERTASNKKTPLTAAAKKCFATEKVCAKCNSHTTTVNAESLCSTCSDLVDKPEIHGKRCGRCGTTITMMWLTDAAGGTVCSSCGYAERYKKDDHSGDSNSTMRGTVTVQRKRAIMGEGDQLDEEASETVDIESSADCVSSETSQGEPGVSGSMKETSGGDTGMTESPPKFVIHKGLDSDPHGLSKKISIVDRLKEKLCTTVIEALKDQMTPEEVREIEEEKEVDSSPEKTTVAMNIPGHEKAVVVLRDLRNDKGIMEKLRDSNINKPAEKNKDDVETLMASDGGSEVETDVSSCGDSDSVVAGEGKKRKKNINKVVQNLKERKTSVDEQSEQSKKINSKEHNTLMLDDSVEDSSILIIDEGESSDSKKSSSGKSDKSRRKGIPAKVQSRSSTSTESSESESRLTKSRSVEVLDEASGHFRRVSREKDSPVMITVVTEDNKPSRKASKEVRSVNISKSLSLSVIKDSAALEMDCAESDADDQVIIDSVKMVPPRPTARKTLPNPPPLPVLASVNKRPASVPPSGSQPPPPLMSLRQNKATGPARLLPSPLPPPRTVPPKPSPRAEVGPTHAKLEEVVQKVVTFVRSTFEEMLRVSADATGGSVEALRNSHQLEMERLRWQHNQEMAELKHNTDLVIREIRASMEADKQRALLDQKHKVEIEKEQAVLETKRKEWCAFCLKEAQLYCCWNTTYCSYDCQVAHWGPHMSECRNRQTQETQEIREPPEEAAPPQRPAGDPAYPQTRRPTPQQLMPPPSFVPPYRHHPPYNHAMIPPAARGFFNRSRGMLPYYPLRGFCPQCP